MGIYWASLVAQIVRNLPGIWGLGFDSSFGKIPWRREWLPTSVFLGIFREWILPSLHRGKVSYLSVVSFTTKKAESIFISCNLLLFLFSF